MTGFSWRTRIAAAAFVAFGSAPAFAEEPIETAIREWVAAIDASPDWVAGYESLGYDPIQRQATLRNLSIRSETFSTKLEVTLGSVSVGGYEAAGDGGFGAATVRAENGRVVFGQIYDMRIANLAIDGLGIPSFSGFAFEPTRLFTSMVKAYAIASQSTVASLVANGIDVDQTYQDQKTHTNFGRYELVGMSRGMIERVTVGPMLQEMPSEDGLLKMRVEKIEALKTDLDAVVDVLDRDRFIGGLGNLRWRTALALETYDKISFEIPGGEIRVGRLEAEEIRLRQPRQNFSNFFDALLSSPNLSEEEIGRLASDHLPYMLQAFGFGAFRLSDIDIVSPDVERFHLGDFHINDLSSDGIGEIGIADLDVAAQDKGAVSAERLAMGGFTFPSMDRIAAAIRAGRSGIDADPFSLVPTFGYAEAVNVDATQDGKLLGKVDRGRLDLTKYIGPVPTEVTLDVRGLDLDLSQVDDRQVRRMVEGMGYDRLKAEYGFRLAWRDADESVRLENFKLDLTDIGSLTGEMVLTGLKRSAIENPRGLGEAINGILFESARFTVTDRSVVDRAVEMQAKQKGQTPDKYREDLAAAMPFTLMLMLKNPGFQQKLAPALQAFIRTPGTMTLTAAPAAPVPLSAVIEAAQTDPRKLPDLLSVDVKTGE